jgi:hypothetical protein
MKWFTYDFIKANEVDEMNAQALSVRKIRSRNY